MHKILRNCIFLGLLFLALTSMVIYGPTYFLCASLLLVVVIFGLSFLQYESHQKKKDKLQRAIRDSARVSIIATDLDGVITEFSKGAQELLGYTREEMVGKITPELLHDPDEILKKNNELNKEFGESTEPGYMTLVRKVYRDDKDENEWTYIHKDGSRFPVILSITPIKDRHQRIRGFLGVATDITHIKEKEELYIRAKEEAEIANRAKSDFLANMSHEIRTPLNGVLGLSKSLLESNLDEDQKDTTQTIIKSSLQLKTILNDILDFTKIESGAIKLLKKVVNLKEFNTDIFNLLLSSNENDKLIIELKEVGDLPQCAKFDEVRLKQVVLNISLNALKFTKEGKVTIEVSYDDSKLFYRVIDTGVGFDETKLTQLLNPFTRGVNESRSEAGTGLGLAIVRELLALMDGGISVESEVDKGTTFIISIPAPLGDSTSIETSSSNKELIDLKGVKVLLVEDNDINQKVITKILRPTQASFKIANNGEEAVKLACEEEFDVILMDYQLPLISGVEATKRIRKLKDTPIIALTANAYDEDRQACLLAGMNDFLAKPVDPDQLRRMIKSHVS